MAYVAPENFKSLFNGRWVCSPTSSKGPFDARDAADVRTFKQGPHYCGQCVSYVRTICPDLPSTAFWSQGEQVKGKTDLSVGTVIATFNIHKKYEGHAAIYAGQDEMGIDVYDQWITGTGKTVGARKLRFGAQGGSNNGDLFYVVI